MTYNFLLASPNYGKTQKELYNELFQTKVNEEFSNSSDIWDIEEEVTFASGIYQDVSVRLNTHLISSITGKFMGDDYKKILFKDLGHAVGIGYMYQFNDCYWITINSEKTKNLAASSVVKRCNNTLRWIDNSGGVHTMPCSIDYIILQNLDYTGSTSLAVIPSGTIEVISQFNDETNLIVPNQRFLFGNANNWTAYKVQGGGVNNYNNVETTDDSTVGFIRFTMKIDYISDNDDLTNGIAYDEKQLYTVSIIPATVAGIPTNTRQLYATVERNGSTVTRSVEWTSSDATKATVTSSGLVTLVANGTAVITCSLLGDASVSDTTAVTISSTPSDNYQVVISPDTNYILEGVTKPYSVYLYKNGSIQANTFTFSLDARSVPSENYAFSYTSSPGNSFSVENKEKFLTDYLLVTCVSSTYSGTLKINLRGSW
jgi:hypothetical protein